MRITMTDKKIPLSDGIERFLNYTREKHLTEDTIIDYTSCCRYFLKWADKDIYCSEISEIMFDDYKSYLKSKNLASATVNNYLRHLKAVINFFIEKEWTTYFKMKIDKRIKIKKVAYTDEEIEKLLKKPNMKKCNFPDYRNWVIICFLLATGVRRNTLINIKISDLNFDEKIINLNVVKNDMDYYLPMTEQLKGILLDYLDIRQGTNDDYLFCSQTGSQLYKSTISTIVKRYNKIHGVSKTSVHLFRHTVAKNWALKSGNQQKLQALLGHVTSAISQEYVNIYATDFRDEFEANNLLNAKMKDKKKITIKKVK